MTPHSQDVRGSRQDPPDTAAGLPHGAGTAFVLCDADVADEPAPRVSVVGATADPVKDYLRQIGKTPLLTAEQEVALAIRIEAGLLAQEKLDSAMDLDPRLSRDLAWLAQDGQRARDDMLEANLRLVVSLAKRHTGHGLPFLDLIQEGNLGLIRAVEKFDHTKGYKFSTYATWWISQGIHSVPADADSEFGDLIEDTEAIDVSDAVSAGVLHQQFEVAPAMLPSVRPR